MLHVENCRSCDKTGQLLASHYIPAGVMQKTSAAFYTSNNVIFQKNVLKEEKNILYV